MYLTTLVAAVMLVPAVSAGDDAQMVLVSPGVLRALADSVTLPSYPISSSAASHTGVAVVEVVVSPSGKVTGTQVLESPDEAIADAVVSAVKRWTFHPFLTKGGAIGMKSRLIFYFRAVEGHSSVVDATVENPASRENRKPNPTPVPTVTR
jgi:TonB family protein